MSSWSKEGGQPCWLLHPKEGPNHNGNPKLCPLLSLNEAAHVGPQETSTFPASSLALSWGQRHTFCMDFLQAQRAPVWSPYALLFLLRVCRSQSKLGWCRKKARQVGLNSPRSTQGGWGNLGTCLLQGSISSSVKWEWQPPPYKWQENLSLRTPQVQTLVLTIASRVSLGRWLNQPVLQVFSSVKWGW